MLLDREIEKSHFRYYWDVEKISKYGIIIIKVRNEGEVYMSILNEDENKKFCIFTQNKLPNLLNKDEEKDLLLPLYDYDNDNINFVYN